MTKGYRVSTITIRCRELIGYSVLKPSLGEEAAFMLARHGGDAAIFMLARHDGDAAIAKRHAQNLCDRLNGDDGWDVTAP